MFGIDLSNPRFWIGLTALLTSGLAVAWFLSPGLPVLIGPWAFASTRAMGQEIFEHEWQPGDQKAGGDGIGPVFNAQSCVACHSKGGVGGGGDNSPPGEGEEAGASISIPSSSEKSIPLLCSVPAGSTVSRTRPSGAIAPAAC